MLIPGKAVKVSIYLTDGASHHGESVCSSILSFLFKGGVAGATAIKGFAGFGSDHHLHTTASVFLADRLPVKIEFIESREKADELMPKLIELARTGMIEVQETTVVKAAGLG